MSQFSKMTGISRPKIAHLLKSLLSKKVIGVTQKGNSSINTYYFQKDFSLWGVLPKKATVTQKGNTLLPKKATEVLPKKVHTINNIKDTYTKDNIKDSWSNYFDLFWKAYPRKVAKQAAIKAFSKLNPDTALLEVILKSIQLAKLSKDWLRDGGQFIPHPATWLNGRRWEDEPTKQPMVNHAAGIINWLHKQKGGVNEPEG